jgi:DNA-binding response OmpR family regulator
LRVTNQEILRFLGRKAITKSKILVVDDDPYLRQALKLRLRANHYHTVHAVDGFSGLALAYKELPNLIILDLGLPAGDGFEVLSHLERDDKLSSIPVIVLTARDPQSSEQRSLAAGAVAFFQKPADNTELLEMIRATLSAIPTGTATPLDLTELSAPPDGLSYQLPISDRPGRATPSR